MTASRGSATPAQHLMGALVLAFCAAVVLFGVVAFAKSYHADPRLVDYIEKNQHPTEVGP